MKTDPPNANRAASLVDGDQQADENPEKSKNININNNIESIPQEPQQTVRIADCEITILGTAHVSRASAEQVKALLAEDSYDAVAVELCASRHRALSDPNALSKLNLLEVLRSGKAPMVMASLALGAYQQRIAEQFGIEPGADMRAALSEAKRRDLPVVLIDREIGVTLNRVYRNVPWWRRLELFSGLLASVVSRQQISEDDIEKLKQGDMLENTFAQFADQAAELYEPLIAERDRYMAAKITQAATTAGHQRMLVVIGAGHLAGIAERLRDPPTDPSAEISTLEQTPPKRRWPKLIPWLIVALVLFGFALGFARNSDLGWSLVWDWVLINGALSALGALIAMAHPITIITAFVAAPLTSLNPTIGAGMVTGAVELWLRKPEVGDFSRLRTDSSSLRGWWKNRVTRVLLVFLLCTLGSAIGTYVAGFRIFERLT